MNNCTSDAGTHYAGCDCHEAAHKAEVAKLREALYWYTTQAMKMNAYVMAGDTKSMMDIMRDMALDNGKRGRIDE